MQDAALGYGISGGKFIWVSLPFIDEKRQNNGLIWWGDEQATVDYAKVNVPRIVKQFNVGPKAVVLCGVSRGSIAVNAIGLFDDEVSKLWSAFLTHDHFFGTKYVASLAHDKDEFQQRSVDPLKRIQGRPYFNQFQQFDKAGARPRAACLARRRKFSVSANVDRFYLWQVFQRIRQGTGHRSLGIASKPCRESVWKWMNEVVVSNHQ